MARVVNKTKKRVLLELSLKEYKTLSESGIFGAIENDFSDYKFVFDEPVRPATLLKSF